MRLLPLVPSAHLSAWTPEADTEKVREAHHAALVRDGHTCRFCGFHADDRQGVVHLDGSHANLALDNLATACLLCDAVQDLGRPTTVQEMLLVWLPVWALLAAVLLFRVRWSVLRTLGVCALVGLAAGLAGLPVS